MAHFMLYLNNDKKPTIVAYYRLLLVDYGGKHLTKNGNFFLKKWRKGNAII